MSSTVTNTELLAYLDDLLDAKSIVDYGPNGLQVQGKSVIKKIITGVTSCQALIDAAVQKQADAVLVHHGLFWQGDAFNIVGMKYKRIKTLLQHEVNLFAYHLPLDIHPQLGNNAELARLLELQCITRVADKQGLPLLCTGELASAMSVETFAEKIQNNLARKPLAIAASEQPIKTVAWCSGAAQKYIELAHVQQVDAFISGEISEPTVHFARENNIHYFAAGHHATERYGVQALGEHVAKQFDVQHEFIDIDNPV